MTYKQKALLFTVITVIGVIVTMCSSDEYFYIFMLLLSFCTGLTIASPSKQ